MHSLFIYLAAGSAIALYASLGVLAKRVFADIPGFSFIAITMFMLTTLSGIAAFMYDKNFQMSSLTPSTWGWVVLFAVTNFIAFSVHLWVLARLPVAEYQIMAVVTPLIGGLLAFLILQEPLSWRYVVGLAIAAVGITIALKK
ncbi:MAG: EamA family transporter [Alphaproteobacteria bacterium]|nr:EamA family transporter [Alphaproteobacteria bacterium]